MRILYVITKANWGGAQRYVFDLATAAEKQGHDVAVAYGAPGELADRLAKHGIARFEIAGLGRDVRLFKDFSAFRSLMRTYRSFSPDVVHLNSSKIGVLGALAARMSGTPRIVFTAHGWAFNEDRPRWQKIPIAFLHFLTVLLCHHTIAVSGAVKRDARFMPFVSRKIVVIRNGIAAPDFLPRHEARARLLSDERRGTWIGTIGELHPVKRTRDLIEAFARMSSEFPDAAVVIIGEGEERRRLESLIREKALTGRVHLLGHVSNAAFYLHAFDLFTLPSRSEGLAYVLVEAGFAGLPVVATKTGGIPEIVEDGVTGLLVPRENPSALARALGTLLGDAELRNRLGAALYRRAESDFSLQQMTDATFALYRS